jgi:tRNA_anti-like
VTRPRSPTMSCCCRPGSACTKPAGTSRRPGEAALPAQVREDRRPISERSCPRSQPQSDRPSSRSWSCWTCTTDGLKATLSAWPGQTNGEGKPASSQAKEAIRTATAQAVLDLYQLNDAAADEQFTDKRVRVSGYLYQVRKVAGRTPSYQLKLEYLKGIQPGPGDLALVFEFPLEARKQLSSLVLRGQAVTVEGRCQGRAIVDGGEAILFHDCRLVAVKAPEGEAAKKQPRP